MLKSILNVPWEHGETLADYELGRTTCALFLSLRYHRLHPNYIYERFQKLGKNYTLRLLLVLVDVVGSVCVCVWMRPVYTDGDRRITARRCASSCALPSHSTFACFCRGAPRRRDAISRHSRHMKTSRQISFPSGSAPHH